jgi:DNA mismatch repair protein MutL
MPLEVRLKPDTTGTPGQTSETTGTSDADRAGMVSGHGQLSGADLASVVSGFSRTENGLASSAVSPVSSSSVDMKPMIPLGQFRDTFIIAVDDEGVSIIDQHVAHERVLFERVMERLSSGRLESQQLLLPMVMDLTSSAQQALVNRAAELDRLGFEVEPFGAATIKVTAVPALLKIEDCSKALLALAEDLEGLDRGAQVQDALQRIAATTACHAAVKANYPLTYEKMAHILDELKATSYSTICPHGRPVMLRLTRREIEKNFDRI